MTTKMYEGKIKNIGIFVDQRVGWMRCIELDDGNIYFLSKDLENTLDYIKLSDSLKRYYYYDYKYLLKAIKIKEFINNNLYRLNDYLLKLSYSILNDIGKRGILVLNIDGVNMLISRSLIISDRRRYQGWLYSYSNPFIQKDFYLY